LQDNKLMKDGQQLRIEILLDNESFVRVVQPYVDNLKRAGIDASIRMVDTSQYQNRLDDLDFDAIELKSGFFPPPGVEMRSYYGSEAADVKGSGNWAGIKNPVVDKLIEQIVAAKDLETLKATTRALDRVLLWQYYAVPEWYNDQAWLAYWDEFNYPATSPKFGTGFPDTWSLKK
jgi:microcin C transport system substrate-binding protein